MPAERDSDRGQDTSKHLVIGGLLPRKRFRMPADILRPARLTTAVRRRQEKRKRIPETSSRVPFRRKRRKRTKRTPRRNHKDERRRQSALPSERHAENSPRYRRRQSPRSLETTERIPHRKNDGTDTETRSAGAQRQGAGATMPTGNVGTFYEGFPTNGPKENPERSPFRKASFRNRKTATGAKNGRHLPESGKSAPTLPAAFRHRPLLCSRGDAYQTIGSRPILCK